jgi:hypothetical protein
MFTTTLCQTCTAIVTVPGIGVPTPGPCRCRGCGAVVVYEQTARVIAFPTRATQLGQAA